MNYWYMDREQEGIYLSGPYAYDSYEANRKWHLNEQSVKYGAVLVKTKRVKVGYEVVLKLFWRSQWEWWPRKYARCFHWLFFMFWLNPIHIDVADGVVKDHLNEQEICRNCGEKNCTSILCNDHL